MCISFPAQVIGFDGADAIVDVEGRRRRASMLMRPQVAVGDWVLIGAGSVLRSIAAAEAAELSRVLATAKTKTKTKATTDARNASLPPGGPR
jgi:hydrogenase expression/formation protein HypC